ncbi:MAG: MFS transporter [Candidatus Dormibacterales bacterium]
MSVPTPPKRKRWFGLATMDLAPLRRHRDFRLLFIGRMVSFFGTMLTVVAFPYQVYVLTHSLVLVGTLGLLEFAAILTFAFVGGALADARDRRSMVLVSEAALMGCSLLLAGNAFLPRPQVWLLFAISMAWGTLDALQRPSLDAMLPRLVDREELAAAAALGSLRGTIGQIAGLALGGVLVATIGLSGTYLVDAATFVVGLVCLWLMRSVPPPVDAERPSLRRVAEGLRYARSRPELIGTYAIDMVAMFFGFPTALFPAMAQSLGGPKVLGLLYAAPAVGSLLFSATSGWTGRVHRHGLAVIVAAILWGFAIVGLGFAQGLWGALVCLACAGGADMMSGLFRQVIWNQTIPDSLRGRLASIELLSYTSGPALGNFEAGAVAALFSIRASIVSGGVLCVIGCALTALVLPGFRAYDARKHLAADSAPAT